MKRTIAWLTTLLCVCLVSNAAPPKWNAQWIAATGAANINSWNADQEPSLKDYGVFKFRKSFELASKPASFVVHVSGDHRYKLYVNEQIVSLGPARGDLYFWNYETVDIAAYLQAGKNVISAVVWNDGKQKPVAQISYITGFILQGNTAAEEIINTNKTWKAIRDGSYSPLTPQVPGYYVAGPGELVRISAALEGWQKTIFDDSQWPAVTVVSNANLKSSARDSKGWMLVPSPLPQMERTTQRLTALVRADGVSVDKKFPAEKAPFVVPANTTATLLLDQSFLTNAYPTLVFSKGKNAGISISYAEALYEKTGSNPASAHQKGNRNVTEGKYFIGKKDSAVSDGEEMQDFTSLWYRTYRYVQIRVTTHDEPLTIEDFYGTFTGYPFERVSAFNSSDKTDKPILDIGWRTARLCAMETYMDCPYYEQLQYIGDARIQALVTLYNTADDRLVRNALTLMDHSRIAEGITLSRYPTDLHQEISTFSLWYIHMLHDYWMYRPASGFVKDKLPGTREILSFFGRYQQEDGSLKGLPYWKFTDWLDDRKGWDYGEAPQGKQGYSSVLDLQLMWTYQVAAEMEKRLGFKDIAAFYNSKAMQLKKTIQKRYWDGNRGLYADTEDKDLFSQHANSLAILTEMVTGNEATALAKKLPGDTILAPASIYYKYYLHQAMIKAGLGNDYKEWLDKWRENIDSGMTTWAEMSDISNTRSDCHAWGSSPNIEYFRTILGINSDTPGFSSVKIEPHVDKTGSVSGSMPHPNGMISTRYELKNGRWNITIQLPSHTNGRLIWKGKTFALKPGDNRFVM